MNTALREVLLISLFNIGALCLFTGLFLAVAPATFLAATARFNRWISTDAAFAALDRARSVDRMLYRRHLVVGAVLATGSAYVLWVFWAWLEPAQVIPRLPQIHNAVTSAWIYDSLLIVMRGAGVVGLVAGIVIATRPSLLKSLEAWGNQWISTDRFTATLNERKDLPEAWFPGHARWFGVGITLGSFYVMYRCAGALWGVG